MRRENNIRLVVFIVAMVGIALFIAIDQRVLRSTRASSSNPPASKTGAPRPSASPELTCSVCHTAAQAGDTFSISGGGPGNTYTPNQTYTITVSHSTAAGTRWGFQITAIDSSLIRAGVLSSTDSTTITQCATPTSDNVFPSVFSPPCIGSERYYTYHTSASTTSSWSFQWTAPASDIGPVTFYVAGVKGNTNASSVDDPTYTTTKTLTAAAAPTGTLQFSGATYSQGESGTATITVTRTGGSSGAASVQFSNPAGGSATGGASCTAGVDYVTPSGTLNWADGDAASKTFSVTICTDTTVESNETVNLALSNATGATLGSQTTATLTINDDDTDVSVAVSPSSVAEDGATNLVYTFTRNGVTTGALTVNFSVGGTAGFSTDYTQTGAATFGATSGTVTFGAGNLTATVTVDPSADLTFEPDETVVLTVTSGTGYNVASPSVATGTIANDDGPPQPGTVQFSGATYSQGESGTATITVTRTGGSSGAASVQFSNPAGGTATGGASCTAGVDYVTPSGTLNWADGDAASKTFSVTICSDNIFEGNETVNLALSNATGATLGSQTTATLTINDDETQPTISINDVSLAEGNSGTTSFIFTVSLSNPTTQTVNVNYATANGTATTASSDYQGISTTLLSFSPLQTSKTVTVLVNGDTTFEPDETFFVNLSGAVAATISDNQGQGTIQNDDGAPGTLQFNLATYSQGEAGGTATITVTRTGGSSGAASVQFSNPAGGTAAGGASCTAGVDYVTPSGTLNWADADAASKTFLVTICNDTIFESNETVNLALSNATGATLGSQTTATLTINDDDSPKSRKTGVFRPSTGELFLKNSNSSGFADTLIVFGNPGDYPIAGDWNGDGIDSVGIYRNGVFYLRNTNTTGFADIVVPFGNPGDQPVVGDWDGDGVDTIGVYRNGDFFLRNSNTAGPPDLVFTLGNPGDVAIAGDWNGDGITTCGVFRPSNGVIFLKNSNTTGFADLSFVYGIAGDKPVAGDWNGDGIDTVGIYRNGQFFLTNSNTTGFADTVFALGVNGDFPIAGNWNGSP
jgi:ribosomal protein L35AE/L33A